jgi:polysaccharide biosynthesis protein PslJ
MAINVSRPRPRTSPSGSRTGFDTILLTTLIVLLVGIPSILIFAPLGAAGTPAEVMGLGLLLIWVFRRISSRQFGSRPNRVHFVLMLFAGAILLSYLAAASRPIASLELNAADRSVLSTLAWLGIALFTIDAPVTLDRLDVVLRRLSIAGAIEAAIGLVQFATHLPLINYIQIPGLTANSDLAAEISTRGDQTRPPGTTIHPIEFGAVLTMMLPLALHYALHDTHRSRIRRWMPVALIAFAIPISISRTAVISAIVALIVLIPTWPVAIRRRAYLAIVCVAGAVYLTVPGLLGTLRDLFTGISSDSSAASRTNSYNLAFSLISRDPVIGRGTGTFLPDYRILDNQLLLTTVEVGLVGLVALGLLLLVPVFAAAKVRRRTKDPRQRDLAQSLAAAVAAGGASFAFYDALAFPMATSVLFLMIGSIGCMVRFSRQPAVTR